MVHPKFSWDMIYANNQFCRFVDPQFKFQAFSNLVTNDSMKKQFNKNKCFNGFEFMEGDGRKPFLRRISSMLNRVTKRG